MSIEIIIDDREHKIIPIFNKVSLPENVSIRVDRINYGDYSVMFNDTILFIIERKTWEDLASSIKDGRKENVKKLIKIREDTKCKLIYLIEGNPIPAPNRKFCRIPYKALRSHLDHLAFRDDIHIVHSKDYENTVDRILELVKNYITIKPSLIETLNKTDVSKLKEKIDTSDSTVYKIWCCVPKITEKNVCLFTDKYHISDLILGAIPKKEIYSMRCTYIIGKRSEVIWNSSRIMNPPNPVHVKMLTQISGITKTTALLVLNTISLEKLLKSEITVAEIADIKKTPTRRVGNKIASDIIKWFCKPAAVPVTAPAKDHLNSAVVPDVPES